MKRIILRFTFGFTIAVIVLALVMLLGSNIPRSHNNSGQSGMPTDSSPDSLPSTGQKLNARITLAGTEFTERVSPDEEWRWDFGEVHITFDIQRPRSADRSSDDRLLVFHGAAEADEFSLAEDVIVGIADAARYTWKPGGDSVALVLIWRSISTWSPPIMLKASPDKERTADTMPVRLGFEGLETIELAKWDAWIPSRQSIRELDAIKMELQIPVGGEEVDVHFNLATDQLFLLDFGDVPVEAFILETTGLDLPRFLEAPLASLPPSQSSVNSTVFTLLRTHFQVNPLVTVRPPSTLSLPKGSYLLVLSAEGHPPRRSRVISIGDGMKRLAEPDWLEFGTGRIHLRATPGLVARVIPEFVLNPLVDFRQGYVIYEFREEARPLQLPSRDPELGTYRNWQSIVARNELAFSNLPAPAHYMVLLEDDSTEPPVVKAVQIVSISPGEIVEIDLTDVQPVELEVEVEGLAVGEAYSLSIWEPFGYWHPTRRSESRWTREATFLGEPEVFDLHPATYEIAARTPDGRESNRAQVTLASGQEAETVRLTIPASLTLPVQLVLNAEQRVAGASVYLGATNSFASQHVRLDRELRGEVNLPAGVYNCRAEVSFGSYPVEIPLDDIDLAAAVEGVKRRGEEAYKLHLAIEKIHVEVIDAETKEPVPHANISLVPVSEDIPASAIAWTTLERYPRLSNATNELGVADVYAPTGQQLAVLTNAADYATDITLINPKEAGSKGLRIELSKWDTEVMVAVRDVDEVVVPGARVGPVLVDGPHGHFTIPWQGVTDQLGRVLLKTRKNTHTAFYVSGPHRDREIPTRKRVFRSQLAGPFLIDSESPEPINVVLAYGSDLAIELKGAKTSERGNIPLSLQYDEESPGVSESFHDLANPRTDWGGRYTWYGLPPGPVRVIVGSPDAPLAEREIMLEPNQRHHLEIELPAAAQP